MNYGTNRKIYTRKLYKIIACFSVWLAVVLACVGLACFSSKVQAGVIITTQYTLTRTPAHSSSTASIDLQYLEYVAIPYNSTTSNVNIGTVRKISPTTSMYNITLNLNVYSGEEYPLSDTNQRCRVNITANTGFPSITWVFARYINYYEEATGYTYLLVDLSRLNSDMEQAGFNPSELELNLTSTIIKFASANNTIAAVDNIYDLQQGDVAIIYISDVSGFDSSSYQPEIIINWGYIDSSDNTIYAVYSPAVNVMKAPGDLEIWLNIPTDAGGTVYDSVILNQQALLTTITEGGASANANIYALYVWLLSDRIQWGLLNFNTAGLPASAMSMNYFTSYTTKYDYINTNTGTMTCRLSISNNFNFITIKNQPVFSVNTINTTLRQGGLLPAWALYNWARGSAAGYTSGTQAGAAPYQPGGTGYNEIFQAGYDAGLTAQPAASWFEAAFAAVDAFLNIHIFPSITFGELFGIPFIISVVWFIIRMFRGGGSSG